MPLPTQPGRASVCAPATLESSNAAAKTLAERCQIFFKDFRGALGRKQVCIYKSVAFDNLSAPYFDATRAAVARKHRPRADKRMELAPLAAGIDTIRKFIQQCLVKQPSREAPVELPRIDADKVRAHSGGDHLARKLVRWNPPARKNRLQPRACELRLAIRADVLQKQIAERDGLNSFRHGTRTACTHRRLILLVRARPRQRNGAQWKPRGCGLPFQQFLTKAVHGDSLKLRIDGCEQADDLNLRPLQQQIKRPRAVLAAAPTHQNTLSIHATVLRLQRRHNLCRA